MTVRNKLACLTGLGLLLLLSLFYIGGRLVVVSTLRQTSRHLLHALPKLQGSVRGELDQLQAKEVGHARGVAPAFRQVVRAGADQGQARVIGDVLPLDAQGLLLAVALR